MNRYSLPHQLHVAAGFSYAVTVWAFYLSLRSPTTFELPWQMHLSAAAALGCVLIAVAITAQLLPRRLEVWAVDRRPFWGSLVVSLIHIYVSMLALQVYVGVLDLILGKSEVEWWLVPLMPVLWQAWFAPITLFALLISTFVGGLLIRYLGGRRDYFRA